MGQGRHKQGGGGTWGTHRQHGGCLLAEQVLLLQPGCRFRRRRRVSARGCDRRLVLHAALLGGGDVCQRLLQVALEPGQVTLHALQHASWCCLLLRTARGLRHRLLCHSVAACLFCCLGQRRRSTPTRAALAGPAAAQRRADGVPQDSLTSRVLVCGSAPGEAEQQVTGLGPLPCGGARRHKLQQGGRQPSGGRRLRGHQRVRTGRVQRAGPERQRRLSRLAPRVPPHPGLERRLHPLRHAFRVRS